MNSAPKKGKKGSGGQPASEPKTGLSARQVWMPSEEGATAPVKITGLDPECVIVALFGGAIPFIIRGVGLDEADLVAYVLDGNGKVDDKAPVEKAGIASPNAFPAAVRAKAGTAPGKRILAVGKKGHEGQPLDTCEGIEVF